MNKYSFDFFIGLAEAYPPVKVGNKYSPSETLKLYEKDTVEELKTIYERARTEYVDNKDINMCGLVPLLLAAYKTICNIKYEEWDKTDPDISIFLCSKSLYNTYKVYEANPAIVDKYTNKKYDIEDKTKYNWGKFGSKEHLIAIIVLQLWYAHPSLRKPQMILDFANWDNMPKAIEEVEEVEKPKIAIKGAKEEIKASKVEIYNKLARLKEYTIPMDSKGMYDPEIGYDLLKEIGLLNYMIKSNEMGRTDFLKSIKEGNSDRFCTLTPFWLYHLKEYYGIKYSSWKRDGIFFNKLLGSIMLAENLESIDEIKYAEILEEAKDMSKRIEVGEGKLTQYPKRKINKHKLIYVMGYQLWKANITFRIPKTHILDPIHLDYVPEPLDAAINLSILD
jgi:hypothetical protein